jgi:hypothetical protein
MEASGQLRAPASLTLLEEPPVVTWVGCREVGPTIFLDTLVKRKIACPYRESNHDSSVIHPLLYSVYRFLPAALKQVVYIVTVVI